MSRTATRVLLAGALLISLAVAALFASWAVGSGKRTRAGNETIRPWMSVPYIAHSQHVAQQTLWEALGMPAHAHDHRSLTRIAREKKKRVEDLIAQLRHALAKQEHATPDHTRHEQDPPR